MLTSLPFLSKRSSLGTMEDTRKMLFSQPLTDVLQMFLSGSFQRAPYKRNKIFWKVTKEKAQVVFPHTVSFCYTVVC